MSSTNGHQLHPPETAPDPVPASLEVAAHDGLSKRVEDLTLESYLAGVKADLLLAEFEVRTTIRDKQAELDRLAAGLDKARDRLAAATARHEKPAAELELVRQHLAENPDDDSEETLDSLSLEERLNADALRAGLLRQEAKLAPLVERREAEVRNCRDWIVNEERNLAFYGKELDQTRALLGKISLDDLARLSQVAPRAAFQRAEREGLSLLLSAAPGPHRSFLEGVVMGQLRITGLLKGIRDEARAEGIAMERRRKSSKKLPTVPVSELPPAGNPDLINARMIEDSARMLAGAPPEQDVVTVTFPPPGQWGLRSRFG